MVTTRGKKINFNLDMSEGELDGEIDAKKTERPAPKRQKSKKLRSTEDDPAFTPGSSAGKGKNKATSHSDLPITRRGGKGGKLRDLMNMPVDIFTEICSYLDPYDLRRLSLTSKRLRDILMTKEARHIWKTAIASVPDLPECPTDLNEPQYVCLLYSSECDTIDCTSRGAKVDWFHRVRFCSACHDVKMTNEWSLRFRRGFNVGIERSTAVMVLKYFDSYDVMRLANNYRLYRGNGMRKGDERHYYIETVKKAGHEYDTLSGEDEIKEYLLLLKERRDYRVQTGTAMVKWKNKQLASRADDIAAEKDARFESIKAKLLAMGWEMKDFPMSDKAFRDLVLKDQKLTPKVWQNIKSKLELMLEKSRSDRLEREKRHRQSTRRIALSDFYHRMSRDIMDLPLERSEMGPFPRKFEAVLALHPIQLLLENDTETVTEEQWIEVAPDVRPVVAKWCRDALKHLVDGLENRTTAQPHKTDIEDQGVAGFETETMEAVCGSIEALKATLSKATSVFHCSVSYCRRIAWFPHNVRHSFSLHQWGVSDGLIQHMRPLQHEGQELVKRLLKDLELDPETVKSSEVVFEDRWLKNFLCTRCDERVARYMDFGELIEHYLDHQKWFDDVTKAVRTSPDSCYPSRPANRELPKIVNDHDWISCDALLARQLDEEAKAKLLKLQTEFRDRELNVHSCSLTGIGGNLTIQSRWDVLRSCLLCPRFYGPRPYATREIKLHIRQKHDKEPDLETDTTVDQIHPTNPCPR